MPPEAKKLCPNCGEQNPNARKKCEGCGADVIQAKKVVKEDFLNKSSSTEIKNLLEKRAHQLWANHQYHVVVMYFADKPRRKRASTFATPGKGDEFRRKVQETFIKTFEMFMKKGEEEGQEGEEEGDEERQTQEGAEERQEGAEERQEGAEERQERAEERQEGAKERQEGAKERQEGAEERQSQREAEEELREEEEDIGEGTSSATGDTVLKKLLTQRQRKEKGKKRKRDWECSECGGLWSQSEPGEDWVKCNHCLVWAHEGCAGGVVLSGYVCESCSN